MFYGEQRGGVIPLGVGGQSANDQTLVFARDRNNRLPYDGTGRVGDSSPDTACDDLRTQICAEKKMQRLEWLPTNSTRRSSCALPSCRDSHRPFGARSRSTNHR